MCKQGQIEISERELSGTCNSTCVGKSYFGPPKRGCTQIDNCRKKETGWKRFFAQCVPCICDCAFSCGELLPPPHCQDKCKAEWACCGAVCVQIHLNIALHMNLPSFFQEWYLLCFFCFVFFKCLQAKTQRWLQCNKAADKEETQTGCRPKSHAAFLLLHPILRTNLGV